MRVDVLLHWLCLSPSRSQAAGWCREGRVVVDGAAVKASHLARAGSRVEIALGERRLRFEILELPARQVARNQRERFLRALEE